MVNDLLKLRHEEEDGGGENEEFLTVLPVSNILLKSTKTNFDQIFLIYLTMRNC